VTDHVDFMNTIMTSFTFIMRGRDTYTARMFLKHMLVMYVILISGKKLSQLVQ